MSHTIWVSLSGFLRPCLLNGALANFFLDIYPSEFQSGLPTLAYLCRESLTFVSHTIWCLRLSTFCPYMDKQNAHNFFSRHFSVRFSEWATYISLFVSCITHICVSHNLVSHIIHILCPCMDKQNARNASGHFSVRISEWPTYISLFVSPIIHICVSHNFVSRFIHI